MSIPREYYWWCFWEQPLCYDVHAYGVHTWILNLWSWVSLSTQDPLSNGQWRLWIKQRTNGGLFFLLNNFEFWERREPKDRELESTTNLIRLGYTVVQVVVRHCIKAVQSSIAVVVGQHFSMLYLVQWAETKIIVWVCDVLRLRVRLVEDILDMFLKGKDFLLQLMKDIVWIRFRWSLMERKRRVSKKKIVGGTGGRKWWIWIYRQNHRTIVRAGSDFVRYHAIIK